MVTEIERWICRQRNNWIERLIDRYVDWKLLDREIDR